MIELTKRLKKPVEAETSLTLPLESRIKSRLRVVLDDGRDAGLFLERGLTLKQGDYVASQDGIIVQIKAAEEQVSTVSCDDPLLLARACYHLGNRHVALQIEPGRLRYLHDHVLDDMLSGLGLQVDVVMAPFEPEPGAYGGRGGHHHHSH